MAFELNNESGKFLVKLARKAIEEYLSTGKKIPVPENTPSKLREKRGVFVTLTDASRDDALRGCIGYPLPSKALVEATVDSAIEAATGDPRFEPIPVDEMKSTVKVEVSTLTPPEEVVVDNPKDYAEKIEIGVDGLIIERGWYKGLLLPQVATEWKMNEEEFLSNCCMKAGLSPDAWLVKGTKVFKFQAIIFHETAPNGQIIEKVLR
jgi:uncharacterized protein (TIGR00296 family)